MGQGPDSLQGPLAGTGARVGPSWAPRPTGPGSPRSERRLPGRAGGSRRRRRHDASM